MCGAAFSNLRTRKVSLILGPVIGSSGRLRKCAVIGCNNWGKCNGGRFVSGRPQPTRQGLESSKFSDDGCLFDSLCLVSCVTLFGAWCILFVVCLFTFGNCLIYRALRRSCCLYGVFSCEDILSHDADAGSEVLNPS